MRNVQLRAEGFGEEERVVHGFRLADIRTGGLPITRVVLPLGFELIGAVGHDLAIFGVNTQRQLRLRDVIKGLHAHTVVGEGEIADRFAEEDLEADGAGGSHRKNVFGISLDNDAGHAEID